jgi:hypothetical protein
MTMQNFLLYDPATGAVNGAIALPEGSVAPMSNMIACTAEQSGEVDRWRVDLSGETPVLAEIDAATRLNTLKVQLSASIDAQVATVYSSWMRFQAEYESREAAAQAYKDAGYTGDVSRWISGFSDAANKTPQEAADLILEQSVSLRGALEALGALRMRKYEVLMAADCDAAAATHASITAAINAVAATIH